ncbi:MAG: copper ion binding protein [Nitrospirota bacterium]
MIMKVFALAALAIILSVGIVIAETKEETITLNVRGMSCSQCTKRVEGELKKINGVKNAEASLKEAKVKITFEKSKVTAEQLTEAINNMGYWVEKKR